MYYNCCVKLQDEWQSRNNGNPADCNEHHKNQQKGQTDDFMALFCGEAVVQTAIVYLAGKPFQPAHGKGKSNAARRIVRHCNDRKT